MNKLKCVNGSFSVENLREFIRVESGKIINSIDIYSNSQDNSFDDIVRILTETEVTEFEIISEQGEVLDSFSNVKLNSINKDIGSHVSVNINFSKE